MNMKLFAYTQIAVHVACFIASFYIVWPISKHMNDFCGHCALFSCGTFIEDDGHFEPNWASGGYCIYSIIVGIFTMLNSIGQILFKIRRLYQVREWYLSFDLIQFV